MSLLTLESIHKDYRSRTVLNGVSLRVERGDRLALIGPNGSGKSTLIKIALGLETPDSGRVVIARGTKVGYISQGTADSSGSSYKSGETALHYEKASRLEEKLRMMEHQLAELSGKGDEEACRRLMNSYARLQTEFEAMDGYTISTRIKTTLLGLGLHEDAMAIPLDSLSGGEKMRVAIAKVLLEQPDLIILDEPTNHLDVRAVEWLEGFLRKFSGGILVVSHDRYFLDQTATRLAELDNGMLVESKGGYSSFIRQKQRQKDYLTGEQDRLKREIRNQKLMVTHLKSMNKVRAANSRLKVVDRLESHLIVNRALKRNAHLAGENSPGIAFESAKHISAEIAKADCLRKNYGSRILFNGVSFLIRGREHVGIVGDNGSGKSTLLNILRGVDNDFEGIAQLGSWVRYAYISQNICFENENNTVMDEIMSRREMDRRQALDYLSRFKFYGDDVNKTAEVLSGGEKVRLYIACIMLEKPDCIIMDEPTNHLDIDAREVLETALSEFNGCIIAVSHDRYFLTRCVNRILEISDGMVKSYEGGYEDYRKARGKDERKGTVSGSDEAQTADASGRKKQGNLVGSTDTDQNEKQQGNPARSLSPVQTVQIKDIERKISELEEMSRKLEAEFDKDTPPEKYKEYSELLNEINRLYSMWENLADRLDYS